jgi:hypothetical protein
MHLAVLVLVPTILSHGLWVRCMRRLVLLLMLLLNTRC